MAWFFTITYDCHIKPSPSGEVDHVLRATAVAVPECNKCIRHLCHLCVAYHSGSLAQRIPSGRVQFDGESELLGEPFPEDIRTSGVAGNDDDLMCPHLFLKHGLALLPQQLVIAEGAAASYDYPVVLHSSCQLLWQSLHFQIQGDLAVPVVLGIAVFLNAAERDSFYLL